MLGLFWACSLDVLRHLGKGKAKLDVAFEFARMEAAIAFCRLVGKLEEAELDGALCECSVVVQAIMCS